MTEGFARKLAQAHYQGGDLEAAFHKAHEERYGYSDRARPVELVAVRTAEIRSGPTFDLPGADPLEATGPCVQPLDGATCWVPPWWVGVRDGDSTLILTRT